MPTPHFNNILWCDYETTGKMDDPRTVPLEGAAIITDGDLNELAVLEGIALQATSDELAAMGDFVRNMHTKTGLLDRVAVSTTSRGDFDAILRDFAAPYFPVKGEELADGTKYRGIEIGGNSVKFDFDVIEKFFPETRALMDYRVLDASSVGGLLRRWNPEAHAAMTPKASDHTALTDIRECVKEVRYYRQVMSPALPVLR